MTIRQASNIIIVIVAVVVTAAAVVMLLAYSSGPLEKPPAIIFQGFDAVSRPGQQVYLTCQLTNTSGGGLQEEPIAFFLPDDKVLMAKTNSAGKAARTANFDTPADHLVHVAATEGSRFTGASDDLLVQVRPEDRVVIWVDVTALIADDSSGPWSMPPDTGVEVSQDAADALKQLDSVVGIVYLTAGPMACYRTTRSWLRKSDVPRGPLIQLEADGEAQTLWRLRECWPNVSAALAGSEPVATLFRKFAAKAYCLRRPGTQQSIIIGFSDWPSFAEQVIIGSHK